MISHGLPQPPIRVRDPAEDPPFRYDSTLWPSLAVLAGILFVFEMTPLDLWVQDALYDFERQRWWVDGTAPIPRWIFYHGPKAVIIALGVGVLGLALGPAVWRSRWSLSRRDLWVVFATLATGPALIAVGKATTGVFCPSEIRRYGGDAPYVRVFDCQPEDDRPARRGRCFPAGHASGGFALVSCMGLARRRRGKAIGFGLGVGVGLWMGVYQMLKGAHYLSHTLVTAMVVWIVYLTWRRIFRTANLGPGG